MGRNFKTRRSVLALTGGALVGLAGCSSNSDESSGDDTGGSSGGDDSNNGSSSNDDEPEHETSTNTVDVPARGYYQFNIQPPTEGTLEWSVQTESDSSADFDVFLFTQSEYEIYIAMNNGDSERPEYITGGTAQGIEQSASRTVTLSAGTYRLVVDSSDYGDAGEVDDTLRVTMTLEFTET